MSAFERSKVNKQHSTILMLYSQGKHTSKTRTEFKTFDDHDQKACDENDGQATTVNTCMIFLVRSLYFTSLYDEMHNSPTVNTCMIFLVRVRMCAYSADATFVAL